jgi:hypothetical protein
VLALVVPVFELLPQPPAKRTAATAVAPIGRGCLT